MSTREELIHAQMIASDKRKTAELRAADPKAAAIVTEPIETVFFFPTKADVTIARKWLEREITMPGGTGNLATALRLVAGRAAVPLFYLRIVRRLEEDDNSRDEERLARHPVKVWPAGNGGGDD